MHFGEQLGNEVDLDYTVLYNTQRELGTNHHKCREGWVNGRLAEHRVQYAITMLQRYPEPNDWQRVRFSDEDHFGWGPEGAIHIIRKPGQRYCHDCIQEQP